MPKKLLDACASVVFFAGVANQQSFKKWPVPLDNIGGMIVFNLSLTPNKLLFSGA